MKTKRRLFLHVELHSRTVTKFERISGQFGMTPYTLASRLMQWFADQEPQIRQGILGAKNRAEMQTAAMAVLRRIAAEPRSPRPKGQKSAP